MTQLRTVGELRRALYSLRSQSSPGTRGVVLMDNLWETLYALFSREPDDALISNVEHGRGEAGVPVMQQYWECSGCDAKIPMFIALCTQCKDFMRVLVRNAPDTVIGYAVLPAPPPDFVKAKPEQIQCDAVPLLWRCPGTGCGTLQSVYDHLCRNCKAWHVVVNDKLTGLVTVRRAAPP